MECDVKWALGSITRYKASGGDGIPAELFQILKMTPLKCCTQHASKFGRLSRGHRTGKCHFSFRQIFKINYLDKYLDYFSLQDWKRSVFIPIPKKSNAKEYSNCHTITLISHASKVMFKSFKLGFSST